MVKLNLIEIKNEFQEGKIEQMLFNLANYASKDCTLPNELKVYHILEITKRIKSEFEFCKKDPKDLKEKV